MTLDAAFDHGHTLDVGAWVGPRCRVQGILFERFSASVIGGHRFGILQLHGVARSQLDVAVRRGVDHVLATRRANGTYPCTSVRRRAPDRALQRT